MRFEVIKQNKLVEKVEKLCLVKFDVVDKHIVEEKDGDKTYLTYYYYCKGKNEAGNVEVYFTAITLDDVLTEQRKNPDGNWDFVIRDVWVIIRG